MSDKEINDGGFAFPGLNAQFTGIDSDGLDRYETQPSGGMTLRDYFATKALPLTIGNSRAIGWQADAAWAAYSVADAMLKARKS